MKKYNAKLIKRLIAIATLIVLLVCIFFAYVQFEDYVTNSYQYQHTYVNAINDKDLFISSIIKENESKAENVMDIYSSIIQEDILESYNGNKPQLEYDITHPSQNSRLNKILDNTLNGVYLNEDTHNNTAFVASLNNVLWSRTQLLPLSTNKFYSWKNIETNHYNSELTTQAVTAIKNPDYITDNIIYWQTAPYTDSGTPMIDSMTMASLINLTNDYGVDSLKNVELLVPVYITKNGDIFDNSDINSLGQRKADYKIILVMRVNVYDAIKPYLSEIQYYQNQINNAQYMIKHNQKQKFYTMVIALAFSVFVVIGSGYIQNKLTDEDDEENCDNE